MVYQGMNSEYYIGMKVPYYRAATELDTAKTQECSEIPPVESPSGSSSHTATQMSTMEDAPEDILASLQFCPPQRHGSRDLDAPLPVRRRQRKPDRRSKASDVSEVNSGAIKKKTPGKRGRPAGVAKAKRVAAPVGSGDDYTKRAAASPKQPLPPRELPARHTPKKKWQDEDVWEAPRRIKPVQVCEAAPPSPVKRVKATGVARARQPASPSMKGFQKDGGPCAVCFVTKSATWRRGAAHGRHSGLPLCNKCGVWEFRHPEDPAREEMEMEMANNRRRTSAARRFGRNRRSSEEDQTGFERTFSAAPSLAPQRAPTPPPVEAPTMLRSLSANMQPLQRWEGNNLVAPVVPAMQHVQQQQQPGPAAFVGGEAAAEATAEADAAAAAGMTNAEPMMGQPTFATGKKRSRGDSDGSSAEAAAKRWHIEAYAGGLGENVEADLGAKAAVDMTGGDGIAAVGCLDCGKDKVEAVAQPVRNRISLKVKMPVRHAAAQQLQSAVGLV